jgi:hypothetical protein
MTPQDMIVRTDIFKSGNCWIAVDINLAGEQCDSAEFATQREAIQAAQDTHRFAAIDVFTASGRLKKAIPPQQER